MNELDFIFTLGLVRVSLPYEVMKALACLGRFAFSHGESEEVTSPRRSSYAKKHLYTHTASTLRRRNLKT